MRGVRSPSVTSLQRMNYTATFLHPLEAVAASNGLRISALDDSSSSVSQLQGQITTTENHDWERDLDEDLPLAPVTTPK
jgi:hypothetical protein